MRIEYITELWGDREVEPQAINIDIDESLSIGDLLAVIHEKTGIPRFRELKWNNQTANIACSYYVKCGAGHDEYKRLKDLEQKISDLPKNGTNGELCLYIDGNVGVGN